jgi:hypothetical protein
VDDMHEKWTTCTNMDEWRWEPWIVVCDCGIVTEITF